MKLFINIFAFYFVVLSHSVFASALPDERNLSTEATIKSYLDAHPDHRTFIGGCGKDPFAWREAAIGNNKWREQQHSNPGDHKHISCVTCAEDPKVKPHILHDLTKPISEDMKGRFDLVYYENLPPVVLGNEQLWKNAFDLLAPGGKLVFDHKARYYLGESETPRAILRLDDQNPFIMYYEYNQESQQPHILARKLKETGVTPFHVPIDSLSLNVITLNLDSIKRKSLEDYNEILVNAERTYGQIKLKEMSLAKIQEMLAKIGFAKIVNSEYKINPYNLRMADANLIEAVKGIQPKKKKNKKKKKKSDLVNEGQEEKEAD